jgi:hypothetical protein
MSPDEGVLTAAAVILGPVSWAAWVFQLLKVRAFDRRAHPSIVILGLTLLTCIGVILVVLNTSASYDVLAMSVVSAR